MIRAGLLLAASAVTAWPANLYVVDVRLPPGASGKGTWLPGRSEAIAARATLRRFLITPSATLRSWDREGAVTIAAAFDRYTIQVEGVRAPGPRQFNATEGIGPKLIHMDGFCPRIASHWGAEVAQRQQLVFDGGDCVFQALYDVRSGRVVHFSINGIA